MNRREFLAATAAVAVAPSALLAAPPLLIHPYDLVARLETAQTPAVIHSSGPLVDTITIDGVAYRQTTTVGIHSRRGRELHSMWARPRRITYWPAQITLIVPD